MRGAGRAAQDGRRTGQAQARTGPQPRGAADWPYFGVDGQLPIRVAGWTALARQPDGWGLFAGARAGGSVLAPRAPRRPAWAGTGGWSWLVAPCGRAALAPGRVVAAPIDARTRALWDQRGAPVVAGDAGTSVLLGVDVDAPGTGYTWFHLPGLAGGDVRWAPSDLPFAWARRLGALPLRAGWRRA